ncbi:hypothetical protein K402DRAFT_459982 [Aulographum hederae CBS 113979]|uniref:Beta/gamma crystallin 'Greek key' domain-containing protein n=1 Tax=Aulographum hederae CBS 113979 TaxID=1176131 RepID=A0A6G1HDZ3_9PEZI|nr:hypothetical protein K402DRAFT_459982 [Aulographum hederae CBS 113979]
MHLPTISILLALAALVTAAPPSLHASGAIPANSTTTSLLQRSQGETSGLVYFCPGYNFSPIGKCYKFATKYNTCFTVQGEAKGKISSFMPDVGIKCRVYTDILCSQAGMKIYYPGYADVGIIGMNDKIASFKCWSN